MSTGVSLTAGQTPERFENEIAPVIQRLWRKNGQQPTCAEVTAEIGLESNLNYSGRWDDLLRAADVPGRDDVVALDIADRLAERDAWQSFIEFQSRDLDESTDLGTHLIGALVSQIESGERSPDAAEAFDLETVSEGIRTTWRAWPADDSQGGEKQ